jgi:hypothetical protein
MKRQKRKVGIQHLEAQRASVHIQQHVEFVRYFESALLAAEHIKNTFQIG